MVNGSCLALLDASYPLHHLYAAVNVALIDGRVRIDPTRKESRDAVCAITFVFDSVKHEVLASHVEGRCSEKHFQECLAAARDESKTIIDFFKESMRKKFSKES
jgi:exosome complex component RRP46